MFIQDPTNVGHERKVEIESIKYNRNYRISRRIMNQRIKLTALFAALFVFSLTAAVFSQTNPTPTPEEVPEVVSRDDSVVEDVPNATSDVRESTDRPVTVPVTQPTEIRLPRSVASPYSIDLSEAQQKMVLYLDLLTRTEARAEGLRSNLFEMIEKENSVLSRIRQVEYSLRPEQIQNAAALSGSLRPEQIRSEREKMLNAEKSNLESLLAQIRNSRQSLENSIVNADRLVERIRVKFEAFVETALNEGEEF